MKTSTRRNFLKHSTTLAAGAALTLSRSAKEGGGPNLNGHHQDFIDCIRNNKRSRADIEIGHLSSSLCHLGNIAIRTGEMLHFYPVKEQMKENAKANKLVRRQYREHWRTPKGV